MERESGREDFFLLLAFLIKEWRMNEIERKRERRAFWAWHSLDHQNHSSKRDFRFIVFLFCFRLRERESGKRKGKGESKKGEEGEMGERKEKKRGEREKERGEKGRKDFYLREREISILKTKHFYGDCNLVDPASSHM